MSIFLKLMKDSKVYDRINRDFKIEKKKEAEIEPSPLLKCMGDLINLKNSS